MFEARRERLLDAMGPDAVAIIVGASPVTRSNDTEYAFRQDSDFWFVTGFDHPDAVAVLRTDGGPRYTLFVQPRDPAAETNVVQHRVPRRWDELPRPPCSGIGTAQRQD